MNALRKESRIVFPQTDNDGLSLKSLQNKFEEKLVIKFGGFTMMQGQGGWRSPHSNKTFLEPVWFYDVAVEDCKEIESELFKLATWLKKEARQETIYLRYPSGIVVYV